MGKHNYYNTKRIYYPEDFVENMVITITQQKLHHLKNVLRVSIGDYVRLFNQQNGEWLAKIEQTEKNKLGLKILKQLRIYKNTQNISLMFTPLKKDSLHFLIEKLVELGVNKLIPILTERTIVRAINSSKINSYILQATEQCERLSLPEIVPLTKLNEAISALDPNEQIIFCDEKEENLSLNKLPPSLDIKKNYIILVGPEGGFTDQERQYLRKHKQILPVHIGPRILKAETAAIFSMSCLQCLIGSISQHPRN